ncbi:hypothetical protein [Aquamicrobium sp.]|jgi:hypothetical protein|uniref:hypothetical protein n=1 Tax=Aquamicrobium sp. TaxID=1872579 RepID=UPI0025911953|nr:hypothetical protein [Aquamicrobium sp.]MCK9549270.1 hypothetical protein [Aquamicrobium sp.]
MEFSNLKITIYLKSSVAMQKRKGAFDSILARLYFSELEKNGTFNGDYAQPLPFLDITDGVYHTSFPIFNGVKYYDKEKLIKTFDHDMYAKYGEILTKKGSGKGVVMTVQGTYKNAFFSIERIGVDQIIYYARGDMKQIASLLNNLRFLGKKSSLGWGEVEKIEIEKIESDYSLIKHGKLMRNIPKKNSLQIEDTGRVSLFRLQHPYWKKTDMVECLMP